MIFVRFHDDLVVIVWVAGDDRDGCHLTHASGHQVAFEAADCPLENGLSLIHGYVSHTKQQPNREDGHKRHDHDPEDLDRPRGDGHAEFL